MSAHVFILFYYWIKAVSLVVKSQVLTDTNPCINLAPIHVLLVHHFFTLRMLILGPSNK